MNTLKHFEFHNKVSMAVVHRLVPDNYRSIFAFLDPKSQLNMAIACRSIVTLKPPRTYRSIREEHLLRSRRLLRQGLPQKSGIIIPLDLYRNWAYRGKIIDIHWFSMFEWFNLYTRSSIEYKVFHHLGDGWGGPFGGIKSYLENMSFEHHAPVLDDLLKNGGLEGKDDGFFFYGTIEGYHDKYHDDFMKRWNVRIDEIERTPLPGRKKKHSPTLTYDDKRSIESGIINPLERLIDEIEVAVRKTRSVKNGNKDHVLKRISVIRIRILKAKQLCR